MECVNKGDADMGFSIAHEFVLGDIAPNYVFGCTWGIYSDETYKRKGMLNDIKKELGAENIQVVSVKNGKIVFITHDVYAKVMGSLESKISAVNVEQDKVLYKKQQRLAIEEFKKYLKRQNKSTNAIIGLYCVNKVPVVRELVGNNMMEYPAFRLSYKHAKEIAETMGIQLNFDIESARLSSGMTAVITPVIIKR